MAQINSSSYRPYGAFELKATYQRNLLLGLLITTLFVALLVTAGWLLGAGEAFGNPADAPVDRTETVVEWLPPPTFDSPEPDLGSDGPTPPVPPPIPDDVVVPSVINLVDDDSLEAEVDRFPDQNERRDLVDGPPGGGGQPGSGSDNGYALPVIPDELPDIDDVVIPERLPELIHSVKPNYPRLAEQAGLEGRVIMKALVSREGDVLEAVIFVGSGHVLLDEAALAVAGQYKYRPAIQNDRPIAIWVTYSVEFKLDR